MYSTWLKIEFSFVVPVPTKLFDEQLTIKWTEKLLVENPIMICTQTTYRGWNTFNILKIY